MTLMVVAVPWSGNGLLYGWERGWSCSWYAPWIIYISGANKCRSVYRRSDRHIQSLEKHLLAPGSHVRLRFGPFSYRHSQHQARG